MKGIAPWVTAVVAVLGILGTSWRSYGALEQRVASTEQRVADLKSDREKDSIEIKTIRLIVTRMCAVTPGCRE